VFHTNCCSKNHTKFSFLMHLLCSDHSKLLQMFVSREMFKNSKRYSVGQQNVDFFNFWKITSVLDLSYTSWKWLLCYLLVHILGHLSRNFGQPQCPHWAARGTKVWGQEGQKLLGLIGSYHWPVHLRLTKILWKMSKNMDFKPPLISLP
jgi:hypothetical protein